MVKAEEPNVTKGKRRTGQTVGYLRVSALDQKELRQLEGIDLDKRFTDKASGKDMHRPQLQQLMDMSERVTPLFVMRWIAWPATWTSFASGSRKKT